LLGGACRKGQLGGDLKKRGRLRKWEKAFLEGKRDGPKKEGESTPDQDVHPYFASCKVDEGGLREENLESRKNRGRGKEIIRRKGEEYIIGLNVFTGKINHLGGKMRWRKNSRVGGAEKGRSTFRKKRKKGTSPNQDLQAKETERG